MSREKCRKIQKVIKKLYERQTPGNLERKTKAAFPDQTHGRANYRCRARGD
jgi:hypothetical protein